MWSDFAEFARRLGPSHEATVRSIRVLLADFAESGTPRASIFCGPLKGDSYADDMLSALLRYDPTLFGENLSVLGYRSHGLPVHAGLRCGWSVGTLMAMVEAYPPSVIATDASWSVCRGLEQNLLELIEAEMAEMVSYPHRSCQGRTGTQRCGECDWCSRGDFQRWVGTRLPLVRMDLGRQMHFYNGVFGEEYFGEVKRRVSALAISMTASTYGACMELCVVEMVAARALGMLMRCVLAEAPMEYVMEYDGMVRTLLGCENATSECPPRLADNNKLLEYPPPKFTR